MVARQAQLDSYLSNIVQKDFREAGHDLRRPDVVITWLRAYAAATSTTTSWEKIRNAASPGTDSIPAKTTVMPYIEVLRTLRILGLTTQKLILGEEGSIRLPRKKGKYWVLK